MLLRIVLAIVARVWPRPYRGILTYRAPTFLQLFAGGPPSVPRQSNAPGWQLGGRDLIRCST